MVTRKVDPMTIIDNDAKDEEEEEEEVELVFQDTVEVMGIQAIFAKGSPLVRKLFWIMVVLLGTGFAMYQVVDQIVVFFSYPTSSSVSVKYLTSITFPRVTICNENPIRLSYMPEASRTNMSVIEDYLTGLGQDSEMSSPSNGWEFIYQDAAHLLHQMLLECYWGENPCGAPDFNPIYTDRGFCYAFNTDKDNASQIRHAGETFGLKMVLDAQIDQYMPSTMFNGFQVMVHDQNVPATSPHHRIPAGYFTSFALDRVVMNSLHPPYQDCGEIELPTSSTYSNLACQLECESAYVLTSCGCLPLVMKNDQQPVCDPTQMEECVNKAQFDYINEGSPCNITCPTDCQQVYYNHEMTLGVFSDNFLQEMVVKHGNDTNYWSKNAVQLNIYYGHLLETSVTEAPLFSVGAMLCNVGGALGLVLGASVITVLELIDFSIMWYCFKRKPRRRPSFISLCQTPC